MPTILLYTIFYCKSSMEVKIKLDVQGDRTILCCAKYSKFEKNKALHDKKLDDMNPIVPV